jgi:uncharacterized protein (DUF486 family)
MPTSKHTLTQKAITAILCLLVAGGLAFAEYIYYLPDNCGCSSSCVGYRVTVASKVLGYVVILFSLAVLRILVRRHFLYAIFPLLVIGVCVYGNGYMLYNSGGCGYELNQRFAYFIDKPLGAYASGGNESIDTELLHAGWLDGRLLGYSIDKGLLHLYRVNKEPLIVKTNFLFWHLDIDEVARGLAHDYSLGAYRVANDDDNVIEFIGGKDMPRQAFLKDIANAGIKYKPDSTDIVAQADKHGFTRLYLKPKEIPCDNQPILGYRFSLKGDFKGDGHTETYTEHYYSLRDQKETNKFYTCVTDVWGLADSATKKLNDSYYLCSDPSMDTLRIGGFIGSLFAKNEGDLDGDGGDEIGYVPSFAQQSSLNDYHIISYKHGWWVELYSFGIWEWQLPPMPSGGIGYGMFGREGTYGVANDSLNKALLKNLLTFHDLLQKLKNGKVKVHTRNDEADEISKIVDLRKMHGKAM